MKKNLIILLLFIIILLSSCFPEINDKMEIITGNFESEIIEEQMDNIGLLTKINLIIVEINKKEYDSLDSNKFISWLDKNKYYEITLKLLIDDNIVEQELKFKGRSGNMPDSYVFSTYFNSAFNSVRIVPTMNEEITGYTMNIGTSQTSIRGVLLYYKNT